MGNKNEVKNLSTLISKRNCQNCAFWNQDGEEDYQGHCGLSSVTCITAVGNHRTPTRWMAIEDSKLPRVPMITTTFGPKGRELFMDDIEYRGAKENKDRIVVMYPDMRELTDESKEQLRRGRAEDRRKAKEAKS